MAGRTTTYLSRPQFVVDQSMMVHGPGRPIRWEYIPESYRAGALLVTANGGEPYGEVTLAVDALPAPLTVGMLLNFGEWAGGTVTVADADVNAGETSFTVVALPMALPAGAVLVFNDGTTAITSAAHAAGVTTLNVTALENDITDAATAAFEGGTIMARVAAPAALAATSVTVDDLTLPIPDDATSVIPGTGTGAKTIPAGTVMAFHATHGMFPRSARPASESAVGLLATNATEGDQSQSLTGFGVYVGGPVYENLLPEASGSPKVISSTYKTEMQTAGVGTGFAFFQYADNTGS